MTLLDHRKNNAISKASIGRGLLQLIDPGYDAGKEDSYIYVFMDQARNLPRELKNHSHDVFALTERFAEFLEAHMGPDHERLLSDLTGLIEGDATLTEREKTHLLRLARELTVSAFLAELFVMAVDRDPNTGDGTKPRMSLKRVNLRKAIGETVDNEDLYDLVALALREEDAESVAACLSRMSNNVYVARALAVLSQEDSFAMSPDYLGLFHSTFSGMTNNKYRHVVFKGCLKGGYFREHPGELLDAHMCEYTNNQYLYDTLILLCELGLIWEAECYRDLLTNKTYRKRFNAYLAEQAATKNTPDGE